MDFKDILLISDYDNTMTGERHLVPEENLRAIREFTAEGGAFTIASGRGMREWYESFCEVPFNAPLVLSNGAVIYDTIENKILYEAVLSEEQKRL
ncbi:MAG: HAD hydrolase family protein, partial [Lachnospiraceae bacterium]|nr:HAD hydrolase family protein [Lachnospiraceae bacterium]